MGKWVVIYANWYDGTIWPGSAEDSPDTPPVKTTDPLLRFSLAGVQLKFSAVMDGTRAKGLTIPAGGVGGDWIVKLPSARFAGVPENEFSMMTLAKRLGMYVPDVQLINTADIAGLPAGLGAMQGQALAVRRFDRTADGPVHMEDFAQIFGVFPAEKYDRASYRNIATVIGAECGNAGIIEFIRRLTFNTLIGNPDMHLKNWSLIYPDRRTAKLAPTYDFLSTIPYIPDTNAALKYARTRKMAEFGEDELSYLAAKAYLPQKLVLDTARQTVTGFREVWQAEKGHLPLLSSEVQTVDRHFDTISFFKC